MTSDVLKIMTELQHRVDEGDMLARASLQYITALRTHIDNLTHEWDEWRTRAMDRCEEAEKWFCKYGAEQQRADNLEASLATKEYPRMVDSHIYQYDENVFVWFDETGGVGGASNYLEEARAQLQQYTNKDNKQWPDKIHESHKIVRSSGVSTSDFLWDDCDATDDITGSCGTIQKPCKGTK